MPKARPRHRYFTSTALLAEPRGPFKREWAGPPWSVLSNKIEGIQAIKCPANPLVLLIEVVQTRVWREF